MVASVKTTNRGINLRPQNVIYWIDLRNCCFCSIFDLNVIAGRALL